MTCWLKKSSRRRTVDSSSACAASVRVLRLCISAGTISSAIMENHPAQICGLPAIILSNMASGDVSLQHFVQSLLGKSQSEVYELALEERPLYLNTNTPSDVP